jgi:hypothetical protein
MHLKVKPYKYVRLNGVAPIANFGDICATISNEEFVVHLNGESFDNRLLCHHKEAIGKSLTKQDNWSNVRFNVKLMHEKFSTVSLSQEQFQHAMDIPVKNCKWLLQAEESKSHFGSLVKQCRGDACVYFGITEETSIFKAISTILAHLLVIPAKYSNDSKLEEELQKERETVKNFVIKILKEKCCIACQKSASEVTFMYTQAEWSFLVKNLSELCNNFLFEWDLDMTPSEGTYQAQQVKAIL